MKTGDRVWIKYEGREIEGAIAVASQNGKSLALIFDAMLGGYVGMMPIVEHRGGFIDLVQGKPVEVRVLEDRRRASGE